MKRKASKGQVALSRMELTRFDISADEFNRGEPMEKADTSAAIKEAECQSPEALNSGEIGASGVKL